MIYAPNMVLIGATGRDAGKTVFACELVRRFAESTPILAAKVTAVEERDGTCPRGGDGCGVCSSLDGVYCLTEELVPGQEKDTQRLLASGAGHVLWLRVLHEALESGAQALLDALGTDAPVVCESNSLRKVVEPGLFIMLRHRDSPTVKASARRMMTHVDRLVETDGREFDFDWDSIGFVGGQWTLRYPATAIVLAGGKSTRMGRDKSLLDVGGRPMIQHVCDQLRPHFDQMVVSTGDEEKHAFLGVRTVKDLLPDQGPLGGMASGLAASETDLNLVVSCDTPEIDVRLIRRMFREIGDHDAVVPVSGQSHTEPLFALYHRRVAGIFTGALASGKRDVRETVASCRVKCLTLESDNSIYNLNTPEEYQAFLLRKGPSFSGRRESEIARNDTV